MDTEDFTVLSEILHQDLFLEDGIKDPLVGALIYLRSRHDTLSDSINTLQNALSSILFPVGPLCPSSLSVAQDQCNKRRLLYLNYVIKRSKCKAYWSFIFSIYQLRSLLPQEVLIVILSDLLLLNPPATNTEPEERSPYLSMTYLCESSVGMRLLRLALQSP